MHAVEKILARAAGQETVSCGEIVNATPDILMVHERPGPRIVQILKDLGVDKIRVSAEKVVAIFDHEVPPSKVESAEAQKLYREYLDNQAVMHKIGAGICHQVLAEKGHVWPGALLIGIDSHTTTGGAFGAFATAVGITEMVALLLTGKLWLKVPPVLKFNVNGKLPEMIMAKDVILHMIGQVKADGALYKAVEFAGSTVKAMSIDSRMVLANMSVEMGAKVGFILPDEKTLQYLEGRVRHSPGSVQNDPDVEYERVFDIDVSDLSPQVACPHEVDNVEPISQVEGVKIHQAFLGSCTAGRLEDLRVAAQIVQGKQIHSQVRFLVVPGSQEVYLQALREGLIQTFVEAGSVILPPGCASCASMHLGFLAAGERCVSANPRNFRGRMGSYEAEIYLASPAVVAASAVAGRMADPRDMV